MKPLLSYSLPFPSVGWYLYVLQNPIDTVGIDVLHRYEKMSYRNRYYITGAQGVQMLSIPLANGRNQRIPMKDVKIDSSVNWQQQHWRTLETNYRRAPFFEFTAPVFSPLFQKQYTFLVDFNLESMRQVQSLLKHRFEIKQLQTVEEITAFENPLDIRRTLKPKQPLVSSSDLQEYYQVFSDRCGFQADLSILDYIFNEGVHL